MQTFCVGIEKIALWVKGQDILHFANGEASNLTGRDDGFEFEEDHNISYAARYTGISGWVGREGIHRTEDVDRNERGLGGSGYHSD